MPRRRGLRANRFTLQMESGMTERQFKTIVAHLQVMIAILGVMAGVLLALAWEYLT